MEKMRVIWATSLHECICGMCDVEYILNRQGNSYKMGSKSRRNQTSYDLETLWINTNKEKDTRTIQYPVISR